MQMCQQSHHRTESRPSLLNPAAHVSLEHLVHQFPRFTRYILLVHCPVCGRRVVTFVARRGQFEGEQFYKCRNHNVSGSWFDEYS